MSAPQIAFSVSLDVIRQHIVYTLARLTSDPRGVPFRQRFKELREEWKKLQLLEFDLQDEKTEAGADLKYRDDNLDAFVDRVDAATYSYQRLRDLLFGEKTPYAFKRPIAGDQLKAMALWGNSFASKDAPTEVQAMAPELDGLLKEAQSASDRKEEATRKLKEFYAIGAKKNFIEKLNRERDEVERYFSKFVSDNPALGLDRKYPLSFFWRRETEGALELEDELALLQEQIEAQKEALSFFENRLKELIAQKESKDREAQEERARQERIEALQRELSALQNKKRRG